MANSSTWFPSVFCLIDFFCHETNFYQVIFVLIFLNIACCVLMLFVSMSYCYLSYKPKRCNTKFATPFHRTFLSVISIVYYGLLLFKKTKNTFFSFCTYFPNRVFWLMVLLISDLVNKHDAMILIETPKHLL